MSSIQDLKSQIIAFCRQELEVSAFLNRFMEIYVEELPEDELNGLPPTEKALLESIYDTLYDWAEDPSEQDEKNGLLSTQRVFQKIAAEVKNKTTWLEAS